MKIIKVIQQAVKPWKVVPHHWLLNLLIPKKKKTKKNYSTYRWVSVASPPAQTAVIDALAAPTAPATALSPTTTLVPTSVAAAARTNPSMAALHAAIAAPPPTLSTSIGTVTAAGIIPTSAAATLSVVTPTILPTAVSTTHQQTSPYLATADAMMPNSATAAAAAQMQLFQQLQAFGLQPAHYLQ
ncbi:hypothetical protein EVAR_71839_1, partial [Eumeta japonica]